MAHKKMRLSYDVPVLPGADVALSHDMPFNRVEVSKLVTIFGPSVFGESSNAPAVSIFHVHLMHQVLFPIYGDADTLANHYARMAKIAVLLPKSGVEIVG
jgi:hypothetical protein